MAPPPTPPRRPLAAPAPPARRLTAPALTPPVSWWRARRGRLCVLVGLVGVWGAIGMGRWLTQAPAAPPRAPAAAPSASRPVAARTEPLARLKVELADPRRTPYPEEFHNIFRVPPPPAPPPPRPVEVVRPAAPPPPPPPPPDPFYEGAKQLRYTAFLQAGDTATAVVTQGTELYTTAAGETIGGRYRVLSVQEETLVLTSPEGDKQVRLALQGGATPSAATPGR
jgi:hypothetical protein